MSIRIDVNADVGEGFSEDEGVLSAVSRANIACGGHAGDETTMRRTLTLARSKGVACGAHPAYPDGEHFGRRSLDMSMGALSAALVDQIRRLKAVAAEFSMELSHLKPHGALYNDAAVDPVRAHVVADTVLAERLPLLIGPPGGALADAAAARGLAFLAEGFVDRTYLSDGRLAPRERQDALIDDPAAAAAQAVSIATKGMLTSVTGEPVAIRVGTICVHGDRAGAAERARAIRAALEAAGVIVTAEP